MEMIARGEIAVETVNVKMASVVIIVHAKRNIRERTVNFQVDGFS